uniref:Uncharacterized protein n=1 Tax=Panagrolaimus sp. PS1159 TaxID=55785 RepID=A0AC35FHT2_9BILA
MSILNLKWLFFVIFFIYVKSEDVFERLNSNLENSTIELLDYIKAEDERNETGMAWNWLAELCDDFGHRHLGTDALEK